MFWMEITGRFLITRALRFRSSLSTEDRKTIEDNDDDDNISCGTGSPNYFKSKSWPVNKETPWHTNCDIMESFIDQSHIPNTAWH